MPVAAQACSTDHADAFHAAQTMLMHFKIPETITKRKKGQAQRVALSGMQIALERAWLKGQRHVVNPIRAALLHDPNVHGAKRAAHTMLYAFSGNDRKAAIGKRRLSVECRLRWKERG